MILNHASLVVTPSIHSGSCHINIAAKTIDSGGVFDYSETSGSQGKVVFTNFIGSCVLRLVATFSSSSGSVTSGQLCTSTSPSAPDQSRVIKASSVAIVGTFPNSIIGGQAIAYASKNPHIGQVCLNAVWIMILFVALFRHDNDTVSLGMMICSDLLLSS